MTAAPLVALVPIKTPAVAKSRLAEVGAQRRRALAEAFARDVVAATSRSPYVVAVVVASDEPLGLGDLVVPDAGGLNESLVRAAQVASQHWPTARPLALAADLPCLRPDDLSVLAEVSAPCFVPDAAGTGTTCYSAPFDDFAPRFGIDSAAAHLAAGATSLTAPRSLRLDVDTSAELAEAVGLGVGAHTAAAVAASFPDLV